MENTAIWPNKQSRERGADPTPDRTLVNLMVGFGEIDDKMGRYLETHERTPDPSS